MMDKDRWLWWGQWMAGALFGIGITIIVMSYMMR